MRRPQQRRQLPRQAGACAAISIAGVNGAVLSALSIPPAAASRRIATVASCAWGFNTRCLVDKWRSLCQLQQLVAKNDGRYHNQSPSDLDILVASCLYHNKGARRRQCVRPQSAHLCGGRTAMSCTNGFIGPCCAAHWPPPRALPVPSSTRATAAASLPRPPACLCRSETSGA